MKSESENKKEALAKKIDRKFSESSFAHSYQKKMARNKGTNMEHGRAHSTMDIMRRASRSAPKGRVGDEIYRSK